MRRLHCPPSDAADAADRDHREAEQRDRRRVPAPRCASAATIGCAQPRQHAPERVELPHVAEVAERRGAKAGDREHLAQGRAARRRGAAGRAAGGVPCGPSPSSTTSAAPTSASADDASTTACQGQLAPLARSAVRHRRAEREHADQPAERGRGPAADPLDDHLHAERIDAGQAEADREAQRPDRCVADARAATSAALAAAPIDAADREDAARARSGRRCRSLRTPSVPAMKPSWVAAISQPNAGGADRQARHQAVGGAARAEPEGGAEPLRQHDQRDRACAWRARRSRSGAAVKRLRQVVDQVVGVLEADRDAQQPLRRPALRPFDRGAMLDQALDAAEAGRAREDRRRARRPPSPRPCRP